MINSHTFFFQWPAPTDELCKGISWPLHSAHQQCMRASSNQAYMDYSRKYSHSSTNCDLFGAATGWNPRFLWHFFRFFFLFFLRYNNILYSREAFCRMATFPSPWDSFPVVPLWTIQHHQHITICTLLVFEMFLGLMEMILHNINGMDRALLCHRQTKYEALLLFFLLLLLLDILFVMQQ